MSNPTWHCETCESTTVYHEAYINPKTGESFEAGTDEGGCECCEEKLGDGSCRIYRSFSILDRQRMEASK